MRELDKHEAAEFEQEAISHLRSLMSVALRLCKSRAEAEDLVQDTYVKAVRARGQYQPGTNLRAWLMKILKNTFINRYHRGTLERTVLGATVPDPVADGWISSATMAYMRDPESAALRPELQRQLGAAIDQLPADFKAVVLMTDVQGFSYQEVADVLGCPIGTVMSRLHRGRKLLRGQLVEHARNAGLIDREPEGADQPIELNRYRKRESRASGGRS